MLKLAIIAVPLFFSTATASDNFPSELTRYDVWIITTYVAETGHDPFAAIQIINSTAAPGYDPEVTFTLYTDAKPKHEVFALSLWGNLKWV
jgi:hypothetical protein